MSSLLSMLGHNLPPVSHETGGGFPVRPGGGHDQAGFKASLQRAISDLDIARGQTKDPEDQQSIAKCVADLHAIIAAEQKERDSAMGLSAQHKFIRRQKGTY